MREGSYHTLVLDFLKANPRKQFSAEELASALNVDPKRAALNSVGKELMRKHTPYVHRQKLNKPEQVRRFYYWYDQSIENDVYQGVLESEVPPPVEVPADYALSCGITIPAEVAQQAYAELGAMLHKNV